MLSGDFGNKTHSSCNPLIVNVLNMSKEQLMRFNGTAIPTCNTLSHFHVPYQNASRRVGVVGNSSPN